MGDDADGAERLGQPQPVQHPNGVGTDRDPGAHLAQDARLLVDMGVEAGLAQREGGGQPADAGPEDEHAHGPLLSRVPDPHNAARRSASGAHIGETASG